MRHDQPILDITDKFSMYFKPRHDLTVQSCGRIQGKVLSKTIYDRKV